MSLHPLADRFASVAAEYERGRPEYPPAVVGALSAELGLERGARVLDLAAGTGKLSRALLGAGLDVVAVEPQPELRALLASSVGAARVHEGLAEEIGLPDSSVRAVTVADAFHWFDHGRALAEIARVLERGGGLAVIVTAVDWAGASWAHELGTLIMRLRPEHPQFDGPPWQEALAATDSFEPASTIRLAAAAPADPERIADHIASMSWIAAMPDGEREATMERVRALVRNGSTPAELTVHYALGLTRLREQAAAG